MLIKKNGFLRAILSYMEKRRLRRSFVAPFIADAGRDAFRYYEQGRVVEINAELLLGPVQRRIYPQGLTWKEGAVLTASEQAEVLSKLVEYFDRHGIKWEMYGPDKKT